MVCTTSSNTVVVAVGDGGPEDRSGCSWCVSPDTLFGLCCVYVFGRAGVGGGGISRVKERQISDAKAKESMARKT